MSTFVIGGSAKGELVLYDERLRSVSKIKSVDDAVTQLLLDEATAYVANASGAIVRVTLADKPALSAKRLLERNQTTGLAWAVSEGERVLALLDAVGAVRVLDPDSLQTVVELELSDGTPSACVATGAGLIYATEQGHVRALDLDRCKIRHSYYPAGAAVVALTALGADGLAVLDGNGDLFFYDVHRPDQEPARLAAKKGTVLCGLDAQTTLLGGDGLWRCDAHGATAISPIKNRVLAIAEANNAIAVATTGALQVLLVGPQGVCSVMATAKPDSETTALAFV